MSRSRLEAVVVVVVSSRTVFPALDAVEITYINTVVVAAEGGAR